MGETEIQSYFKAYIHLQQVRIDSKRSLKILRNKKKVFPFGLKSGLVRFWGIS